MSLPITDNLPRDARPARPLPRPSHPPSFPDRPPQATGVPVRPGSLVPFLGPGRLREQVDLPCRRPASARRATGVVGALPVGPSVRLTWRRSSLSPAPPVGYAGGMDLHNYPTRFLIAAAIASLLLLGLCGTVAVFLNGEQSRTADELAEDIRSRKA